jgi:long-chain acyl-CoA synthetase
MRLTQGIERAALIRPHATATIDGARRRTWAELRDRIAALAAGLRALGIDDGARVAILAHNSDHYLEAIFATLWAGGIVVPLNTRWSPAELTYALNDSGAALLFADAAFLDCARGLGASCAALRHVISLDEAADASPSLVGLIQEERCIAGSDRGGQDIAGIFYTGGTTGFPKGVMLSHAGIMANGLALGAVLRLGADTVFLHAAPMFHVADASFIFSVTTFAGAHVIVPGFTPAAVAEAIRAHGVTDTMLVPTMIAMLLDHCAETGADITMLRQLVYGASPMSEALLVRTIAALPHTRLAQGFGQTELSPVATVLEPQFHATEGEARRLLRSAGRPLPTVDIKIMNAESEAAPGEVGEIWARGPNTMAGYWNKPELTAQTLVDGWVRTGDLGRLDADGFLYVVDRLKDMIVSGGENVYSAEVENAIAQHPQVAACAVIGVPDEKWGERVHAIVVAKPGPAPTEADILAHCRPLLANYKCPRSVEIRSEPLPLSSAGKVLKAELRQAHWRGRERAVN